MNNNLYKYLPLRISRAVQALPEPILSSLTEIRLRSQGPLSVTAGGKSYALKEDGTTCEPFYATKTSREEIKECLSKLCVSSLYSFEDCISKGFIPFENGGRAGICGEAIYKNGEIKGFREIHSINLRIRRHVKSFGLALAAEMISDGLKGALIFSPPNCGKTTLLRSTVHLLADGSLGRAYKLGIADERSELFTSELRASLTDAICSVPKAKAVELLYRSLSPDLIACDEISPSDGETLLDCINTGVPLLATAHASNKDELLKRPFVKKLADNGAFPLLARVYFDGDYRYELLKL